MANSVKYKIAVIVILSSIFGMASGIVGEIVARVYILEEAFNIPLFGDINFQDNDYGGSSLVIRNPSKVIVEQNTKVEESKNSAKRSIVGIFAKKTDEKIANNNDVLFDVNEYFQYNEELGSGIILTSDGWILTDFISEKMKNYLLVNNSLATTTKNAYLDDFIVVTSDKKIYKVDNIVLDPVSMFSFWHIEANDLPVKNFTSKKNLQNGEILLAVNWDGWSEVTTLVSKEKEPVLIESSSLMVEYLTLDKKLNENFNGNFLFNLNNDIAALINSEGKILSTDSITPALNSLLNTGKINPIKIGINYINLSGLIKLKENKLPENGLLVYKDDKGVAVIKDSPADIAGLKEGDIITAVDNIILNNENTLQEFLSKHVRGDEITLYFTRNNEKNQAKIILN